jgi:hypothetical protein
MWKNEVRPSPHLYALLARATNPGGGHPPLLQFGKNVHNLIFLLQRFHSHHSRETSTKTGTGARDKHMTHDPLTITPGHIWTIIDVDLKTAQLTDEGNAELSALIHEGLCQHTVMSFSQWQLSRCLIKVRNIYTQEFTTALRDILEVNTAPRSFFVREQTGSGRGSRPLKNGRLASII